jgi:hypothetical protein
MCMRLVLTTSWPEFSCVGKYTQAKAKTHRINNPRAEYSGLPKWVIVAACFWLLVPLSFEIQMRIPFAPPATIHFESFLSKSWETFAIVLPIIFFLIRKRKSVCSTDVQQENISMVNGLVSLSDCFTTRECKVYIVLWIFATNRH